jgi:hypothetical protein
MGEAPGGADKAAAIEQQAPRRSPASAQIGDRARLSASAENGALSGVAQMLVETHVHLTGPAEGRLQDANTGEAPQSSRLSQKTSEGRALRRHLKTEVSHLWTWVGGVGALCAGFAVEVAWLKMKDIVWGPVGVFMLGIGWLVPLAQLVRKNRCISDLADYIRQLEQAKPPPEPVQLLDEFQKFISYVNSDGDTHGHDKN